LRPRHAIIFTILIAILLPYYYYFDRPEVKVAALKADQESLLKLSSIDSITVIRGDKTVQYQATPDGKHWELVQPAGKFVPQDLMQALVALLLNAKSVEVVSTNPNDLAEFGLNQPRGQLIIKSADRKPIDIYFGNENPTGTAIYARIEGIPKIFLLGKNLEYYQTLMFQWVEGKQGKNA
jgi:hypothetical protein